MEKGKGKEALFFTHLALEKGLKALVIKATDDIAPFSHDLPFLVKLAREDFPGEIIEFFAIMNQYSIHGRYPEPGKPAPSREYVQKSIEKAGEVLKWLKNRL